MARLLGPDANSRLVYTVVGPRLAAATGATATVYADAAGTVLADIRAYDGTNTPGAAITGSTLTVDGTSLLPKFWLPDGADIVWVKVAAGPITAVNADYDARLDVMLPAAMVGAANGAASLDATGKIPAAQLPASPTGNMTFRGAWAATTVYAINDVITFAGGTFLATGAHTSGTSFALANWANLDAPKGVYNVLWYGAKGDGATDDTAAINAAVTAAYNAGIANGTYYAEVYFPPAVYLVNGPLTQGGATKGNSVIPLPVLPTTGQKFTLVFRGTHDATALWHWQQTTSQKSGAVLKTTLVGTQDATYGEASVIGGPTPQQGYGRANSLFSNMLVVVDGLMVLNPNNPAVCGYDFRGVAEANVNNASVMADATPATVVAAANAWQFGLAMPMNNNNDKSTIGSYSAEGQNYGVFADEHTVANSIHCIYCVAAVEAGQSGDTSHGMVINYLSAEACQVGLGAAIGSFPVKVDVKLLDWEGGGPAPGPFACINDANNVMLGTVNVTGVGASHLTYGTNGFTVRNASNLRIYDVSRQAGTIAAPAVPVSATATLNPYFRDAMVVISGGTVTAIAVDGVTLGVTSGVIILPTNKTITLTYSVAPTWVWTLL